MFDQWSERLSEYVDGELDAPTRSALEAHLATCEACSAAVGELRAVVRRASTVSDRPPATDLWPGVMASIQQRGRVGAPVLMPPAPVRRVSLSIPQLIAAGLVLALISGGTVWTLRPAAQPAVVASTPVPTAVPVSPVQDTFAHRGPVILVGGEHASPAPPTTEIAVPAYDAAVADLQRVLSGSRSKLKPETVRVLEQNLRAIDRAIADARRALKADPGSANYLNQYLQDQMTKKLQLMRRAADIVSAAEE